MNSLKLPILMTFYSFCAFVLGSIICFVAKSWILGDGNHILAHSLWTLFFHIPVLAIIFLTTWLFMHKKTWQHNMLMPLCIAQFCLTILRECYYSTYFFPDNIPIQGLAGVILHMFIGGIIIPNYVVRKVKASFQAA